jgi:membrane-bound inhibitor of C-type lysozyme
MTHGTPWALAAALLAGCAGGSKPAPQAAPTGTTVYACPDGFRFSVRPREDSVLVSLPEGAVALPAAPAASGARYSAGGIRFWSKGAEGSLEQEGTVRTGCPGRSAGDPWEEALRRFLQVLERVDRAAVVGDDMTLYAGDQPLARFVAVYFR